MKRIAFLSIFLFVSGLLHAANPRVVMETNRGTMTIELYPDKAPKTVKNFLDYVQNGYYSGTIFHRVIPKFMIQGGGFAEDLSRKGTNPPVPNEAENGLSNVRGTISMARTEDPHSATGQFFINLVDNKALDHTGKTTGRAWGYCVFGKVVEGMTVADKIAAVKTGGRGPFTRDFPLTPIVIKKVTIEKGTQSAPTN